MKLKIHLIAVAILLVVLVLIAYILIKQSAPDKNQNPYALDLDKYYKIDDCQYCKVKIANLELNFIPVGIAVDASENLFITGNSSLYKLNWQNILLQKVELSEKAGAIAFGSDSNLYIAVSNHIEVVDKSGLKRNEWQPVNPAGFITSVSANPNYIFAADSYSKKIYYFDYNGNIKHILGKMDENSPAGNFVVPSKYFDCAVGPDNELWVANPGRQMLVKFNQDTKELYHWGASSAELNGFCGCCNPSHFAIMADGSFITSEKGIVRVKKYNSDGTFNCIFPIRFPESTVGLDIAISKNQYIYVLDPGRKLVLKIMITDY